MADQFDQIADQVAPGDLFDHYANNVAPASVDSSLNFSGGGVRYAPDEKPWLATANAHIQTAEAGHNLVKVRDNPDGTADYEVQQSAPRKMTAGEKQAIYAAHESNYKQQPIGQGQTFDQMADQIRGATAAGNSPLENFSGGVGQGFNNFGAGIVGTVSPKTAETMQENGRLAYSSDPDSTAGIIGHAVGGAIPFVPAVLAGPGGIEAATTGLMGASTFGNVRTQIAERRAAGENISTGDEIASAAVQAAIAIASAKIRVGGADRGINAMKQGVERAITQYAHEAGIQGTQMLLSTLASNAVDHVITGKGDAADLGNGVGEAGLTGIATAPLFTALGGVRDRGVQQEAPLTPTEQPASSEQPAPEAVKPPSKTAELEALQSQVEQEIQGQVDTNKKTAEENTKILSPVSETEPASHPLELKDAAAVGDWYRETFAKGQGKEAEQAAGGIEALASMNPGKFVLRDVPVGDVDSLNLMGNERNPQRVSGYAKLPGKTAPPIIAIENHGKLVIADGGHRLEAADRRGDATIKAYVPESYAKTLPDSSIPTKDLPALPDESRQWTFKQMKHWAEQSGYDTSNTEGTLTLRKSIRKQQDLNERGKTFISKPVKQATQEAATVTRESIQKTPPLEGTSHARRVPRMIEDYLTPIASRVRDLSPRIFDRLMSMEFRTGVARENEKRMLQPVAERLTEALGGPKSEPYKKFKVAVLNGDFETAMTMLPEKNQADFRHVEDMFSRLLDAQKQAGVKIGELPNYWARYIKDYRGFDAVYGDNKGRFEEAWDLARKMKGTQVLTAEEKADIANDVLQGFGPRKPGSYGPANARERTIAKITPEQAGHYSDPFASAMRYIDGATYAAERSSFLGRNHDLTNLADTVGKIVQGEVEAGHLNKADQEELTGLLHTRFTGDMLTMSKTARTFKQVMYLTSLGQFRSALNQITDVASTASSHGVGSAIAGVGAALHLTAADHRIVMEDVGLHDHGEEFKDISKIGHLTDWALRKTGFKVVDRFGKENRINAAWDAFTRAAKTPDSAEFSRLERDYKPVLGDRFEQTMQDLREGKKTEDARYLLFLDIAKVQPVTMSNMPAKYLQMKNGRILYAMKTFTLNQLDFVRRDMIRKIATPGQRREGLRNLAGFSVLTTLVGLGKDLVNDLIRGKHIDPDQIPGRAVDAMLGVAGMSRYNGEKFWTKPTDAAINYIAPPASWIDASWNDVKSMGDGSGLRSIKYMPVIGDLLYYWAPFGKGGELNANEAKADFRHKLNGVWQQAYQARQDGDNDTARTLLHVYNDSRKQGPGDGRNTPLTFDDLQYAPTGSEQKKEEAKLKPQAVTAIKAGDTAAATELLKRYNVDRKNKAKLSDIKKTAGSTK